MSERQRESITLPLTGDGFLRGDFSFTDTPRPFAVLCVHGFGSHRGGEKVQAVEAACARRGWTFASFDFCGHGESSGTMLDLRGSGLLADLDAVREFLIGRGVQRFFLFGSSMGGWATSWFAARHASEIPAVVLLAPAFQFLHARWSRLSAEERNEWERTGKMRFKNDWVEADLSFELIAERDQFPPEKLFAEWQTPALVFHGMRDEVVSYGSSMQFIEHITYPTVELRLFRDGDHRLTTYKDELAEEACRFFTRFMP